MLTDHPDTDPDYQFVMQVQSDDSDVHFESGSCEHRQRVAGKGIVELIVSGVGKTDVWAAWAAGHKAVRLTPFLSIRVDQDDGVAQQRNETASRIRGEDW